MGNVSAARAKAKGNKAFQAQKYEEAVSHFTEAIEHDPSDIILYSNRSASYAFLEDYTKALKDGERCVSLDADWARGYARKGLAEFNLCRYDRAQATYKAGLALAPADPLLIEGIKEVKHAKSSPFQRGMIVKGLHGEAVEVPFAIANSRVSHALQNLLWPEGWPYAQIDFQREDSRRRHHVAHIDDGAIAAIRRFYALQFAQAPQGEFTVLDICSAQHSHYPTNLAAERVVALGANEDLLQANEQATEFAVKDLNTDPTLPFRNREFDFVTNALGVGYITRPREVFSEVHRVMKPGGVAIISFSNHCFPEKAISMWLQNMDDGPGHCQIVGNYFHFNPQGGWDSISSIDLSHDPRTSDPMWVVTAVKARVDPKRIAFAESEGASEAPTDLPFSTGVSEATSETDTQAASSCSPGPDVKPIGRRIVEE